MKTFRLGALVMFVGVTFGALGAHALKHRLSAESLEIYEKGVFYHFVHGLAILAMGAAAAAFKNPKLETVGWIFAAGTLAFSGSLYALALGAPHAVGMITPLGGLLFLFGWLLAALA